MLSENEIIEHFRKNGIFQGGELYLATPAALKFLTNCEENDLAVIGVEGFQYHCGKVKPLLDQIADYSSAKASRWEEFRDVCNTSCKAFIFGLPQEEELVVNFTVLSQEEWRVQICKSANGHSVG